MKSILKNQNPWPVAIIAYFILFISAMVTWIVYASHQKLDLVSKDYYEQEIQFQKQVDRLNNTAQFRHDVAIRYDLAAQTITLKLPPGHAKEAVLGRIHLYRPSDASLDEVTALAVDISGAQTVNVSKLQPGFWKVQLYWRVKDQEYYFNQPLTIGSAL